MCSSLASAAASYKMKAESNEILKDFPRGPLCEYRKKASFNWKDMGLLIQGRDALILKVLY